jgi:hypothetical protein
VLRVPTLARTEAEVYTTDNGRRESCFKCSAPPASHRVWFSSFVNRERDKQDVRDRRDSRRRNFRPVSLFSRVSRE